MKRDLEAEGNQIADSTECPTCGAKAKSPCLRTDKSERPYWLVHRDRRLAGK